MNQTNRKGPLLLLLTATIWGVAFVAQSVGMDYVGPFTFNAVRSIIGALVLIPFLLFQRRKSNGGQKAKKEETADSCRTLLIGGICCGVLLCIATNLQQIGIQYTTVGKAGFITALYIVLVPILGIFLKRRIGFHIWISVALAVIGLYLLCMTQRLSLGAGDTCVLLCALFFSFHILAVDHFSPMVDGVALSCIQFFICGLLSAVPMLIWEKPQIASLLAAWKPILYAGALSCGVGYTLQIVGQKNLNPTVASLIMSLESVVSVLAGWLLLGQKLSARELCGCVLMFAAIILAQLPERPAGKVRERNR